MAWRSQEQSFNFKKKLNTPGKSSGVMRKEYHDGFGPDVMPDEFFAKEDIYDKQGKLIANKGDFNLQQVKGEQARNYFERVLRIPLPSGASKMSVEDPSIIEAYKGKQHGRRG